MCGSLMANQCVAGRAEHVIPEEVPCHVASSHLPLWTPFGVQMCLPSPQSSPRNQVPPRTNPAHTNVVIVPRVYFLFMSGI